MSSSQLTLIQGDDRYTNMAQALGYIVGEVTLADMKLVLVKPNWVVTERPLAVTHVNPMRAALDFDVGIGRGYGRQRFSGRYSFPAVHLSAARRQEHRSGGNANGCQWV